MCYSEFPVLRRYSLMRNLQVTQIDPVAMTLNTPIRWLRNKWWLEWKFSDKVPNLMRIPSLATTHTTLSQSHCPSDKIGSATNWKLPDLTTSLSRYLPSFLLKVCVDWEQIGNFCFLIFATESTWYPTLRYHHSWYRTCKRKHTLQWTFFLEARSAEGKERLLVEQDFTAAS